MADFICQIRIYVPYKEDGTIDNSALGHYDLQINAVNGTPLSFDGKSINNPVFSYCEVYNVGAVKLFDMNDTMAALGGGYYGYTFSFEASAAAVWNFITAMSNTYLDTSREFTIGNVHTYPVKSGPFVNYSVEQNNCFAATASWVSMLGQSFLLDIYQNANHYTDYTASKLLATYGSAWTYAGKF